MMFNLIIYLFMKNSFESRLAIFFVSLVVYIVSSFLSGVWGIVAVAAVVATAAALVVMVAVKNHIHSSAGLWYVMCFFVALSSLLGRLQLNLSSELCSVIAFGLVLLLFFRGAYYVQRICHKDCESKLDKE